jgi:hypothetical protein
MRFEQPDADVRSDERNVPASLLSHTDDRALTQRWSQELSSA